jgi:hypothetical protein
VPHQHNEIYPLADGAAYFADLVEQLATAHQRVTIAAWSCTPLMPLLRGERERESVLAEVLNRVSQQAEVYLLLWAGAPKLFHPETKDVEEVQRILGRRARWCTVSWIAAPPLARPPSEGSDYRWPRCLRGRHGSDYLSGRSLGHPGIRCAMAPTGTMSNFA